MLSLFPFSKKLFVAVATAVGSVFISTWPESEILVDNLIALASVYLVGQSVVDTASCVSRRHLNSQIPPPASKSSD